MAKTLDVPAKSPSALFEIPLSPAMPETANVIANRSLMYQVDRIPRKPPLPTPTTT